jgi:hypothetical protein
LFASNVNPRENIGILRERGGRLVASSPRRLIVKLVSILIRSLLVVACLVWSASIIAAATPAVRGRITDPDGLPLPGVVVTLTPSRGGAAVADTTGANGEYAIDARPGHYRLTAELSGFSTAARPDLIVGNDAIVVDLALSLASFEERVTVTAAPAVPMLGNAAPDAPVLVTRDVIDSAMLPNSQYDDALTLMPNVVRGPDGFISVAGARATQGALLVNGGNKTDPITGAPGVMLPIEAVDGVQVYSGGYPATFGLATGGVTSVVTRSGADHLHMSANSFFPRLLYADGGIHGVEYWEPNAGLSAPLIKGRLWIEQAISYRYDRNRIDTLVGPQDSKFTTLLSWSQVDVQVSPRQHAVISVSRDPQSTDRANITAFTPAATVPQLRQGGWSVTAADRITVGEGSSLEIQASTVRTALAVTPNGAGTYDIGHDLTRGSYFDRQDLHGRRTEAVGSYIWTAARGHLVKIGASAGRGAIDGSDGSSEVDLLRSDGTISRAITFAAPAAIAASTNEIGAFADDTWTAASWLTVDAGVRYDRTSAAAAGTVTPRVAWTIKPAHGNASVSGSAGLFADKLVLGALAFPSFPSRTEQVFDASGVASGAPITLANIIAGPLRTPRAARWDLAFDDRFDSGWLARAKYQERHGRDELVLNPEADAVLALSSTGTSTARSLETTVGYRAPKARHEIYVSYVRASTHGDLNSVDAVQGIFKEPFVQPNAAGPLPMDVPNRVLAWGLLRLPGRVTVAPFVDVRNGFPYSAVDENWLYVGERDGQRLPWFGSLDLYVNKIVGLPRHLPDARVGLKLYNLASMHSARDVQRDIDRPDFGTTYNPIPRDFTMVFELLWGNR